jgi:predicted nuclease of predicted toxin-antitoxin system
VRFFLDQNVDARVADVLRDMGHEAWTADDANLSAEADPNLTIYAHDRRAVLLTHDREFSKRFEKHIVGHHVYLDCGELAVRGVIDERLYDLLELLSRYPDLYAVLRVDSMSVTFPSQRRD